MGCCLPLGALGICCCAALQPRGGKGWCVDGGGGASTSVVLGRRTGARCGWTSLAIW